MGDGAGSSRPGVCKYHPRQQGDGVCAICLRVSLEKLAAYQREHQEPPDSYTGGYSSTSVAEFSRERDNSGQSFQPSYPSVSYRTRSRKEPKPRGGGGFSAQDGSTSDSRKSKDGSGAKSRLSWGVAVHRIASIRSAFTSLWKSDRHTEEKKKHSTGVRDKHHVRAHVNSGTNEAEGKEKFDNGQHSGQSGKLGPLAMSSAGVNGEPKRNSSSSPWTGSSSFISKFTQRSSNPEDSRTRWRRSKSSREGKRDADAPAASEDGPPTPDGNQGYDAPSPLQPVPHPSSKTSPWMFFSRSGSRRSPFKVDTPKGTPRRSVASDTSRPQPAMGSDVRRYPLSRGPSPKPDAVVPMSKSALSSPSMMAIQDPHSQTSLGSKSSSLSRTLSSSSSKPSPLYLPPRTMEIHGDSPSRASTDVPQEFHDQWKAVSEAHEQHSRRGSEIQNKFPTGAYGSELPLHMTGRMKASVEG